MKFALATCALLAVLVGTVEADSAVLEQRDNALDQMVIEFLENFKQSMTCGIPDLSIPVLAPFELDHFEVNVEQTGLKFKGEMNNLLVDGLNEFEIKSLHINLLKLQLTFEFHFGSIRTKGAYRAKGRVIGLVPFDRKGPFQFNVNGLTLKGSAKVAVKGENVQVRELQITPTIKSVNSNIKNVFLLPLNTFFFNRLVESVLPGVINDNQETITATIEENLKPMLNELLGEFTLQDLIDMASGDGSSIPVTC
uniref:Hemolymph juvenile hormone binding protein n=1 Tax=Anopheles atroparvus TaxID=41427 RepID=A0AAG5CZX3_ANOAO